MASDKLQCNPVSCLLCEHTLGRGKLLFFLSNFRSANWFLALSSREFPNNTRGVRVKNQMLNINARDRSHLYIYTWGACKWRSLKIILYRHVVLMNDECYNSIKTFKPCILYCKIYMYTSYIKKVIRNSIFVIDFFE